MPLILAACDTGDPFQPPAADEPRVARPATGITRDTDGPGLLVGEWARDEVVELDGARQRRTIIWRFDASGRVDPDGSFRGGPRGFTTGGTCRLTIAFFPAAGLDPLVNESVCVYEASAGTVTLRFPEVPRADGAGRSGEEEQLTWSVPRRDVLVLDGVTYLRIGG